MVDINQLFRNMLETGASDLHLKVPSSPVFRINGELVIQKEVPPLSTQDIADVFKQITSNEQRDNFYQMKELDFVYSVPGIARFRVNAMLQRGSLGLAFRMVPDRIPTLEELNLPEICKELILRPRGMILVTGPTGSGKSTTLASMIQYLNSNKSRSIITIEDPIEFLYPDDKCIIAQRDLGDDTNDFATALKHALRHDPDVIVVGEMRDLETVSTAVMAAETGHLVLGTLHTTDAAQTVDRIIDIFPGAQQPQIRLQLSQVLVGIISQTLLAKIDGSGRIAACEVLIANTPVRNLIREGKVHELVSIMQLGGKYGMTTLNNVLADLVRKNLVTSAEALSKSSEPRSLRRLLNLPEKGEK